jgi:hypothetical protein
MDSFEYRRNYYNFRCVLKELLAKVNGDNYYSINTQIFIHNIWVELRNLISSKDGKTYYDESDKTKYKVYKIIDRHNL